MEEPLTNVKAMLGALAIMMASGMIADFDVSESGDSMIVRVWSAGDEDDASLRGHVAALLSPHIGGGRVIVVPSA